MTPRGLHLDGAGAVQPETPGPVRDHGEQAAHDKAPHHIRFVDELPVTVTRKPQKFIMRELMMRELGLAQGLVDFKIASVDATWSGLLFNRRKPKP